MKYMFKFPAYDNVFFTNFLFAPFWKHFTRTGRKADCIIKLFIKTGINLSHTTPIIYHDLKNTGLNVSLADSNLLELLRETYHLADILFNSSLIKKNYTSSDKSFFNFTIKDRN